ncbi:zinc finger, C2H2 [Tanacetum coccineum]|uniref:Zinc finger, C2H2 n=1 Tax=Tanacetum coccineum TaxID=301880 RepID=A0ABQ4WDX6_9ASTR
MPTVWFSLKKSLHCKSDPREVHDPKSKPHLGAILTRKPARSGCSRSIANLKDVINGGSKRHEKPVSCSPRSIGSNEFVNPITHEVILSDSRCELKITGFNGGLNDINSNGGNGDVTLHSVKNHQQTSTTPSTTRRTLSLNSAKALDRNGIANGGGVTGKNVITQKPKETESYGSSGGGSVTCHKCGKQFGKWENLEAHHLSKHAVTELMEGDSSRKIVEIICRSSLVKAENNSGRIEKVLKVHNMQKTLARFEEYRELVKTKASKLPKKHPRCLADGNELLRFYGTTIACSLGINGETSLCISDKCCVCRIIRHGFSSGKELKGGIGVFTTSTSARAFESIEVFDDSLDTRKALMVCRVIAGRVHRPLENIQEITEQTGFDSLAGKVGLHSNIEDLYLLSPKALLPCFVVICKL